MNKTEFIEKLSKELDTTKAEASKNFDAVIKCITHVMKDNDELRFTGFGTFKTSIRKATKMKTPQGVMVDVPEKRVLKFSVGSDLKDKAASKK